MNLLNRSTETVPFKNLHKACLAVLFIVGSVFLPTQTAQANVFDPLLRVLLPFYEGDDSVKIEGSTKQPDADSSTASTPTTDNDSPHAELEQAAAVDIEQNSDSLSQSIMVENDKANYKTISGASDIFANTDHPSTIINQTNLPLSTEPSLYELLDAEFAYDRGDIDKALTIYKQQSFGKDATAIFERALTLSLAHEDVAESLRFASTWQQQNPDHVPAWFYVAHLALQAHEYDLAGDTLETILEYDPKADFSQILQGIYPDTESDKRALLATLQELYSEENANLSILKAGLLLEFNKPEEALINTNHALAIEPNNTPFITLKADILRQLNNRQALLYLLADARKRLPDQKALYLYEIRYRLDNRVNNQSPKQQKDNLEKAWQLLMTTAQRFPEDPEVTLLASLVSLDTQRYATGDKLLSSLLDRPAYIDQAYYYLGVSAERQNQYQKAKDYFANVMQENLALEARKKVVAYYLIQEDTESAINTLISLRRDFPIYAPDSYILQADILKQLSKHIEAKTLLAQANLDYPNNNALLFAYAKLMDANNTEESAQKREILAILRQQEPNNLAYQLEFAKLLLTQNPTSIEGKQLATQVINTSHTDPRFDRNLYLDGLNTLATAELALENYTQVLAYLQAAYEVLPSEESGKLLLQAYQGLGDTVNANKQLADMQQKFNYQDDNIVDDSND